MIHRRDLLKFAGFFAASGFLELKAFASVPAPLPSSLPAVAPASVSTPGCLAKQTEFTLESSASPFFTHFHQLSIPVIHLLKPPTDGITLQTSAMDLGSYDNDEFKKFTASSGLDPRKLSTHSHDVFISSVDLVRIASGEKEVEIRVVSPSKNFVHTFLITATPSTLVKIHRFKAGLIKA